MLLRTVFAMVSLASAAGAVAGDLPPHAIPPQPAVVSETPLDATASSRAPTRVEAGPSSQRSERPAVQGLGKPVSFGGQSEGTFPTAAVGSTGSRPDDAAQGDALNAPFWVFLLWYMGSR